MIINEVFRLFNFERRQLQSIGKVNSHVVIKLTVIHFELQTDVKYVQTCERILYTVQRKVALMFKTLKV